MHVTVLIPVFNGEQYVGEAIESVLAQTIGDCELLVIDDGSTDKTPSIAKSYGSRLTYHRQENRGVAGALNNGISHAKGKYIAWLSHDDRFHPTKLEKQLDFMERSNEFAACYADYQIIGPDGSVIRDVEAPWYPRREAIPALFASSYINGSSMFIERSVFDRVGLFNERYRYSQDMDMWFRILRHFEIGRVPEKLLQWRSHPAQGSRNREESMLDEQAMYLNAFETLGIAEILTDQASKMDDPRTIARGYAWFGDTMSGYRSWYRFAAEQYRRSLRIWPSLRNPALIGWIANCLRPIVRASRRGTRRALGS